VSVGRFLVAGPPPEAPFDVVFCDPPYETPADDVHELLVALATPDWLGSRAMVVTERRAGRRAGARAPEPSWPDGWLVVWERTYGDTLVSALRPGNRP
jgi:16S rRNA (guanine966-N2)-methyltransferase